MYERVILLTKIEIIDYNSWSPYEGFAEGSGRSEKIWLQSSEGRIGPVSYTHLRAHET